METQIILTDEQQKVVHSSQERPLLVKGSAGSGKSVTTVKRAIQIAGNSSLFARNKVLVFTYNKTLVAYLQTMIEKYTIDDNSIRKQIEVKNYHSWAWQFIYKNMGITPSIIKLKNQRKLIKEILSGQLSISDKVKNLAIDFYISEFEYLKNNLICKEDYVNTPRKGNGNDVRLKPFDKMQIWQIFDEYNNILGELGKMDFSDLSLIILDYLEAGNKFNNPYSNIMVDEAQDFTPIELKVISSIAGKRLSLFADLAQRIYQTGFSWRKVGINIIGRSAELRTTFRNNEMIAKAAQSLLSNDGEIEEFFELIPVKMFGHKPIVVQGRTLKSQYDFVINEIKNIDLNEKSVVILHRIKSGLVEINNYFMQNANFSTEYINNTINTGVLRNGSVKLSTIHSVKGLEFDYVFIVDATDRLIPYYQGLKSDIDSEEFIEIERRLLFTAMTRTKEKLYITYHGSVSRFVKEINPEFLDFQYTKDNNFNHKISA